MIAHIVERRAVIARLAERHMDLGRRLEAATSGLRQLEDQLAAIAMVIDVFDETAPVVALEPIATRPPLRAVPAGAEPHVPVRRARTRQSFKPIAYLHCLGDGHAYMNSRAAPGYATCTRCRYRQRM